MLTDNTNVDETTQNTDETVNENEETNNTKSYEDLKAEAETLEAELKTSQESQSEAEKIANQERRIAKLKDKLNGVNETIEDKQTLDADDVYTLRENGFSKDSDEAKILAEFAQIPSNKNKTYQELLQTAGVKAEIEAVNAKNEAARQIDKDSEDFLQSSKKEIANKYEASGEVPESAKDMEELAKQNVEKMFN